MGGAPSVPTKSVGLKFLGKEITPYKEVVTDMFKSLGYDTSEDNFSQTMKLHVLVVYTAVGRVDSESSSHCAITKEINNAQQKLILLLVRYCDKDHLTWPATDVVPKQMEAQVTIKKLVVKSRSNPEVNYAIADSKATIKFFNTL